MNHQFDELAKSLAQTVTRRGALKKFSVGIAGMALACFGLVQRAEAARTFCIPTGSQCRGNTPCCSGICSNRTCVCAPSGGHCLRDADCCSGGCIHTFTNGYFCK
jgi:hypothetical protein